MTTEYAGFYKNFVVDTNGGGDVNDMPYVGVVASSTGDVIFIKEEYEPDKQTVDENGDPVTGIQKGTPIDSITRADAYCDALNCTAVNATGNITTTNGSVGIGTTTPDTSYKLDVNGAIKASGNIIADGRVGIGKTPGPSYKLDVDGHLNATGSITGKEVIAAGGDGGGIYLNGSTLSTSERIWFDGVNTIKYAANSKNHVFNGSVGIGKDADPAYKLDVNGDIKANGNIDATGDINCGTVNAPFFTLGGKWFFGLGLNGEGSQTALYITHGSAPYDEIIIKNNTTGITNMTIDGTIRAEGDIIADGSAIIGYSSAFISSHKLDVNGSARVNDVLYLGSGTVDASAVGFAEQSENRTNTYIKFEQADSTNDWCLLRQIGGPDAYHLTFDFYDGEDARFSIRDIDTVTTNSITTRFSVDPDKAYFNGSVGIGTPTPGSKLHIVGDSLSLGDNTDPSQPNYAQLEITSLSNVTQEGANKPANLHIGIDHRVGSYGCGFIQTIVDITHRPYLSFQPYAGSVGIGTATPDPAYKLDVAGDIRATKLVNSGNDFILGSGALERGDSGESRALVKESDSTLRINYLGDFTGGVQIDSDLAIYRIVKDGSGGISERTETIRLDSETGNIIADGRVGIGISPNTSYKLDVAGNIIARGNIDADGAIKANAVIAASGETGGIYLNGATTNGWERIWYDGVDVKYGDNVLVNHVFTGSIKASGNIEATGNVGIGTAPSAYKLDVNGSIKANGNIDATGNIRTLANVGIGFANLGAQDTYVPTYAKLTINGSEGSFDNNGANRFFNWERNLTTGTVDLFGLSIFATNDIATRGYIVSTSSTITASDERIKENIEDISDTEALDKLRLLKPKTYTYKDTVERGTTPVIGFIAQEVREVIPTAVSVRTDVIPNIYELATVSQSNVITFTNFNTSNLQADSNMISIRTITGGTERVTLANTIDEHTIQVVEDLTGFTGSVDENGKVVTETITQEEYDALESKYGIVPKYTPDITKEEYDALTEEEKGAYTVEYSKPVGNQIFVYGQEVDDFNFLKKESVFTVATAALQEVDRQQQADKQRIATLENLVQTLIEEVAALKAGTAS